MSDFVSVLDVLDQTSYNDMRNIREEVAEIDFQLRRVMDAGLTPEDMVKAKAAREASQTAITILENLFV